MASPGAPMTLARGTTKSTVRLLASTSRFLSQLVSESVKSFSTILSSASDSTFFCAAICSADLGATVVPQLFLTETEGRPEAPAKLAVQVSITLLAALPWV